MKKLIDKLPPVFKKRWVDALRSKKYSQCDGALRSIIDGEEKYCVLGVAYQLGMKRKVPAGIGTIPRQARCVPSIIKEENPVAETLFEMNDAGATFEELADYIDHNL